MNMTAHIARFAFASFVLFGASARADQHAADRLHESWNDVLAAQENVLTPQQFAKLNNLAFQAAAVRVCEGLDLDETKFVQQLAEASAPTAEDLTEDEAKTHASFVLIEFGIRVGVLIAEGNENEKAFCDGANELKAKADIPNVWE